MQTEIIPVGLYEANCTVLWRDPAKAWVVDPGADGAGILERMEELGVTPGLVLITHGHFDHIGAVNEILKKYPDIPVYLSEEDAKFAFSAENAIPGYPPTLRPSSLDTGKKDGDEISFGELTAKVILTPGHTPGGWCLYLPAEHLLFSGDTLFCQSCGRTDFPGGSWQELGRSLKRLRELPDDTRIICGHGPETSIAAEKQNNPYFQE